MAACSSEPPAGRIRRNISERVRQWLKMVGIVRGRAAIQVGDAGPLLQPAASQFGGYPEWLRGRWGGRVGPRLNERWVPIWPCRFVRTACGRDRPCREPGPLAPRR